MISRDPTSDPLQLLRETADVTPPESARLRVAARLASSAGAGMALAAVGSLAPPCSRWKVLGERFVRWSLLPLGAGIAMGAGGHAYVAATAHELRPSLPVVSSVTKTLPVAPAPVPSQDAPQRLEPAPGAALSSVPVARSTLAEERALLDRARKQLALDEPARALTVLEQHAQRFPRGQLTEEREAMWINVLVRLERKGEAKARGESFAARFPNSLMSSSVRAALQAADVSD
jgi:hypothetical protein